MMKRTAILAATALTALSACGAAKDESATNAADDFAARIKGDKTAQEAPATAPTVAPKIVPPKPDAAPGAYAPGTATDPESSTCGANRMGPFLNKTADDDTRQAIMDATQDIQEVRFIAPGSDYIKPDPTNPRLNIMIDVTGVIRDARCG